MTVREREQDTKPAEKKGVERVEAAITENPTNPSPFLKELSTITGPAAGRALTQMDKDGYTGRAEALEANKILDEVKGSVYRHLPFTDNAITKKDVDDYARRPVLTDGERAIAQRLSKDFNNISTDGQKITPENIATYEAREKQHADMRNLYAKDNNGKGNSLYDSVSDKNGGISGEKLDARLKDPALSPQDKASLDAVNKLRPTSWGTPYGDVSAGALKQATDASGLTPQERTGTPKRAEPQSADAQAGAAALTDLTAKPAGGGQSLLDKITDGKGGVSISKTEELIAHPERHNLTPKNLETLKYLDNHAPSFTDMEGGSHQMDYSKADLQKLGADSGVNFDKLTAKPATVAPDKATQGQQQDFSHIFDKTGNKPSLYERIKSNDGSVSLSKIDEELKKPGLDAKDRHSLDYLKSLAKDGTFWGKKDISPADMVEKAHEHNVKDAALKRGGLEPAGSDKPAVVAPPATGEIKPEVHKALTVRSGEGYYHAAERLLSEAHKGQKYEPTQKELKDLVHQLQNANHHKKSLRSHEELVIDQTIRTNPALAGLFK